MLTLFEIIDIMRFIKARGSHAVWARYGNLLVYAHVGATARLSTTNIAGDMLRETLELQIRRHEQQQHTRRMHYEQLGERIVNGH